jgi:flagellar hook-associated protein 2
MAITATGIGSGVDVEGVVTKIIAAEGAVKNKKIDTEQASAINKISAYATLTSVLTKLDDTLEALSSNKTTSAFQKRIATAGTNSAGTVFFKATADNTATPNTYNIQVTDIAYAQQASSIAFGSSATVVGTGDLNFTVDGTTHTVNINSTNNTVSGIAASVNDESAITGVSASLIKTDTGVVLAFTSTKTGTDAAFTITVTNDSDSNNTNNTALSQLATANLSPTQAAANASIIVNGLTVTSQSNQLNEVLTGVNLTLVAPTSGSSYILSVTNDNDSITTAVKDFVKSYNTLVDNITNLSKHDPDAKYKKEAESDQNKTDFEKEAGVLNGDATLLNVQSIVRRLVYAYSPNVSGIGALSDIGITTNDRTGHLALNENTLSDKLTSNFADVNNLFSHADRGIATKLDAALEDIIDPEGILPSKTEGLTRSLVDLTEQRIDIERYLDSLQSRLLAQFSAMDRIVGQLKTISSFLEQQSNSFLEPMSFRK